MIKLYSYFRSTAAYRVRIALNWKNLEHELVSVDLLAGEDQQPAYRAINPQDLVPALEHDGRVLSQSMAILEYLEENFPTPALLPAEPSARRRARTGQRHRLRHPPAQQPARPQGTSAPASAPTRRTNRTWYHHWLADGFRAIETRLAHRRASCCFGDEPPWRT